MYNEQFILFNEKDKFIYILKSEWKNLGHFMESAWTLQTKYNVLCKGKNSLLLFKKCMYLY